jgi:hypothetical protein
MWSLDRRLNTDGVHAGKGRGGNWNKKWEKSIEEYPAKIRLNIERELRKNEAK